MMKLRFVIFQECRLATICVSGVYCVYQGGQSNTSIGYEFSTKKRNMIDMAFIWKRFLIFCMDLKNSSW